MLIADILRYKGTQVHTISAAASLKEAIDQLAAERIGALLVSNDGRTIEGILSERDIVRGLANDAGDFAGALVGDLMTRNVFSCAPESTLAAVMELMTAKRIRHVPVTVKNRLRGVVSIGDIVNARLKEAERERQEMADYIAGVPAV